MVKKLSVFALLLFGRLVCAENNIITISAQQIDNLGIKTGSLQAVNQLPLFSAPAKVVVPSAHEFIASTPQAGLVVKMNVSVGDKVSKGDAVAIVNSPDLLTLQGSYLRALGALKLANANYTREKTLRNEGVVSGRVEQESYASFTAARIQVNEAEQLLRMSGMSEKEVSLLVTDGKLSSQIVIKSPVSGRVIERLVLAGTRVDGMTPLYRIANLDELWLEINVPQEHIADIKIGDKVRIENSSVEAVVRVLGQTVNSDNQALVVRALIKGDLGLVKAGQKVTIQLVQERVSSIYQLPDTAIAHNKDKTYLFTKQAEGFTIKEVTLVGKSTNGTLISGNFSGDEVVALNNVVALKAIWLGLGSGE